MDAIYFIYDLQHLRRHRGAAMLHLTTALLLRSASQRDDGDPSK